MIENNYDNILKIAHPGTPGTSDILRPKKIQMGQVTKLWLSCYLVLLSIGSKTR